MINHYTVDVENPRSWDEYFYNMCRTVASNSKCLSRKIGAVIVLDKTIISTGYNGPPRGVRTCDKRWLVDKEMRDKAGFLLMNSNGLFKKFKDDLEGKCPRYVPEMGFKSGQGLEWCVAGHAERNAIVNSARMGLHALKGTKIYMSCGIPCTPCLIEIQNAGIEEIICVKQDSFYDQSARYLLKETNIKVRQFDFIKEED